MRVYVLRLLLWIWLIAVLTFAMFPGLDIAVSGWFYDPGQGGFFLDKSAGLQTLRDIIWNLCNLVGIFALLLGVQACVTPRSVAVPGRIWGFSVALIVLGPLLLVNACLKSHWGRARPADIEAFGRSADFTPPWQLSDQCTSNCSFVSGEASAVVVAAIIVGLLLWNIVAPRHRRWMIVTLVCFVSVGAGLRLMTGRHFLSDVVWAIILMSTLAAWLAKALRIGDALSDVTAAHVWQDVRHFCRGVWGGVNLLGQLGGKALHIALSGLRKLHRRTVPRKPSAPQNE